MMPPDELKQALGQIATEAAELKAAVGGGVTDMVADWLAPQYAVAAREQLANAANPEERWKALRLVVNDLSALRRGDHCAERLKLERERLALLREQCQKNMEAEFEEWVKRPEIHARLHPKHQRERVINRVGKIVDHFMLGTPLPEFEDIYDEEPKQSTKATT